MDFVRGVYGSLSAHRSGLVRAAYAKLDTTQSGVAACAKVQAPARRAPPAARSRESAHFESVQVKASFVARDAPAVKSGKRTEAQLLKEFLDDVRAAPGSGDVTCQNFCDYYAGVSASIDDDAFFQLMLWSTWSLGGEGGGSGARGVRR